MACCLTAPSRYLNQCWQISEDLWHPPGGKCSKYLSLDFSVKITNLRLQPHLQGVNGLNHGIAIISVVVTGGLHVLPRSSEVWLPVGQARWRGNPSLTWSWPQLDPRMTGSLKSLGHRQLGLPSAAQVQQVCPNTTLGKLKTALIPTNTDFQKPTLTARFKGPTWSPSGADRTQVGPMLAPWTLLSGQTHYFIWVDWDFDTTYQPFI